MKTPTRSLDEQPTVTYVGADGTVLYGVEAQDAMIAKNDADQQHNTRVVAAAKRAGQLARLEQVLRERATPAADEFERTRALWRLRRAARSSTVKFTAPLLARTGERDRETRPKTRAATQRSSARSGDSPGGGGADPEPDHFRLTLIHEKHALEPVAQTPPRSCRCDRDRPYTAPNWDIEPDGGHCRGCDLPLRDHDVRRAHAIARDARSRLMAKGWSL
jgi:hypothetical protein